MRRLPPLNSLRAFEITARRGSLTKAAQELCVTPTAVSRHLKNLEEALQVQLFEREASVLKLTQSGRQYASILRRAFQMIGEGTEALMEMSGPAELMVRCYSTFLVRWMMPRLSRFRERHPEIELKFTTGAEPEQPDQDTADIAIRYGYGRWAGVNSALLFGDEVIISGNDQIRGHFAGIPLAEALARATILVNTRRLDDWPDWLEVAGIPGALPRRRMVFDDLAVIHQSAVDGLGITLTQRPYIEQELRQGSLHQLSEIVLRRPRGYHVVCRPEIARSPAGKAFLSWIVAESAANRM